MAAFTAAFAFILVGFGIAGALSVYPLTFGRMSYLFIALAPCMLLSSANFRRLANRQLGRRVRPSSRWFLLGSVVMTAVAAAALGYAGGSTFWIVYAACAFAAALATPALFYLMLRRRRPKAL